MPDPYLIPGTVVLQNKLGISDFDELEQAVADVMAYRLFDKNTPVPPTLAGWRAVHKAMFGSVFEWAGDFRNVNARKSGDDDSSDGLFAPSGRLVADGQRAVLNLENTVRRIQTAKISLIADNLADVYDQLNYLHPFREGNGRSQKVFFSLVCRPRGLQLNWSEIPSNEHNLAAQQAMRGDISLLRKHSRRLWPSLPTQVWRRVGAAPQTKSSGLEFSGWPSRARLLALPFCRLPTVCKIPRSLIRADGMDLPPACRSRMSRREFGASESRNGHGARR